MILMKVAALTGAFLAGQANADDMSMAYFMGHNHPMNHGFLAPMSEEEKAAIHRVTESDLSTGAGETYAMIPQIGMAQESSPKTIVNLTIPNVASRLRNTMFN
ncbi:hypothetical protein Q4577_20250 [Marinovum sp. 2_MG-2023]|uniref:hypothetical protein n=1 Tax=unclassified Marinovum TaxID=2647166 RepID=UPI0026E33472|nr:MULTISPECIES: hypothetical protein [unclassified Marinovum]MDO6732370.1 hypothetical protein [Marinovum sp. 2_MG-2023]MDO6781687.1 hypothetical protein [Marinovum sp. 1_MG-2023]